MPTTTRQAASLRASQIRNGQIELILTALGHVASVRPHGLATIPAPCWQLAARRQTLGHIVSVPCF